MRILSKMILNIVFAPLFAPLLVAPRSRYGSKCDGRLAVAIAIATVLHACVA